MGWGLAWCVGGEEPGSEGDAWTLGNQVNSISVFPWRVPVDGRAMVRGAVQLQQRNDRLLALPPDTWNISSMNMESFMRDLDASCLDAGTECILHSCMYLKYERRTSVHFVPGAPR